MCPEMFETVLRGLQTWIVEAVSVFHYDSSIKAVKSALGLASLIHEDSSHRYLTPLVRLLFVPKHSLFVVYTVKRG